MADGDDSTIQSPSYHHGDSKPSDVEKGISSDTKQDEKHSAGASRDNEKAESDRENIVSWEEPAESDPANPMAWPKRRKWLIIGTMSFMTFLT